MSLSIPGGTGRTDRYVRQPSVIRSTPRSGQPIRATIAAEQKADIPRLLAAAPILAVCTELEQHVDDLRRLAPASDATTALTLYRDKLSAALNSACEIELFISADQAAVIPREVGEHGYLPLPQRVAPGQVRGDAAPKPGLKFRDTASAHGSAYPDPSRGVVEAKALHRKTMQGLRLS